MKIFYSPIILLFIISCNKDENMDIYVELNAGEIWKYEIGSISTEGGVDIIINSDNFEISEIRFDSLISGFSYFYQSKNDFNGVENVTLRKYWSIGGRSTSFTDVNITFKVMN